MSNDFSVQIDGDEIRIIPIVHPIFFRVMYAAPFWQVDINNNTPGSKWQSALHHEQANSHDEKGRDTKIYPVNNFKTQREAYSWVAANLLICHGGAIEYQPESEPGWFSQLLGPIAKRSNQLPIDLNANKNQSFINHVHNQTIAT
jgi:hypothetical protein